MNLQSIDSEVDINPEWNDPATPTFYNIDHDGTIRHKWLGKPGETSVDRALETLS